MKNKDKQQQRYYTLHTDYNTTYNPKYYVHAEWLFNNFPADFFIKNAILKKCCMVLMMKEYSITQFYFHSQLICYLKVSILILNENKYFFTAESHSELRTSHNYCFKLFLIQKLFQRFQKNIKLRKQKKTFFHLYKNVVYLPVIALTFNITYNYLK